MPYLPAPSAFSDEKTLPPTRRQWLAWSAVLAMPLPALAQGAGVAVGERPELVGSVPGGSTLRLDALRGQVVLVFYWATTCAVCRDKMGELRANLEGWKGQPFTVLGVNMDRHLRDFVAYEALVAQTVPKGRQFVSVSGRGADFKDSMGVPDQLPSASLIDKEGRLVERYTGRIPASTWDRIADLL